MCFLRHWSSVLLPDAKPLLRSELTASLSHSKAYQQNTDGELILCTATKTNSKQSLVFFVCLFFLNGIARIAAYISCTGYFF